MIRAFRHAKTGEWFDLILTIRDGAPSAAHVADVADAYGVDPSLVEVIDGHSPPDRAVVIEAPGDVPAPPPTISEQVAALTDAVATLTADLLTGGA